MDGDELVIGALLNFAGEFAGKLQMEYLFTFLVPETQDHGSPYLNPRMPASEKLLKSAYFWGHSRHKRPKERRNVSADAHG
jgi:hypothetical protein